MAKKDTNAPKRAKSAYIIFCQENRETLLKKKPGLKATEVTKELGEMWRNLSDAKRKPFEDKAQKDKERYTEEKENYQPPSDHEAELQSDHEEKKQKRVKKEKDENAPKREVSNYIRFCQAKRSDVKEDHPDFGPKEITSELGRLWRELDDKQRAKYASKPGTVVEEKTTPVKEEKKSKGKKKYDSDEEEEEKPKKRDQKPKKIKSKRSKDSEDELSD